MIGRILVGLGGTPDASVSTATAIELAKQYDARLTGVTVVDLSKLRRVGPVPVGGGAAAEELREHRIAATHERVEACLQERVDFPDHLFQPVSRQLHNGGNRRRAGLRVAGNRAAGPYRCRQQRFRPANGYRSVLRGCLHLL